MNRVLVIDDEPQIRRFLRISLESQGYELVEAADAAEGLAQAAAASPDLIVLDLGLPDRDGQSLLREIRTFFEGPVIVLSVRNTEAEKVQALDGGCNDYVVKPFGVRELLARVRGLLRTFADVPSPPAIFDDGTVRIDLGLRRVFVNGMEIRLSKKEFELLRTLMAHPGRIVTQQHLLREVWGQTHDKDTHYLRVFIARLRGKLGDDAMQPSYIETEPGVGYRFIGAGE